ncbi:MAG TPA: hypothetical protein VGJ97_12275 [Anaerolineaceae bacterium]
MISPVDYIDYDKNHTSDANAFYPFFCKDKHFKEEREVRFAFIQNFENIGGDDFDKQCRDDGVLIPMDKYSLIEEIVISPFTEDIEFNKLIDDINDNVIISRITRSVFTR